MKAKGMPIDRYRMSIEARPLQVLYSKYSSTDSNNTLQCVRPLGSVRNDRKLSSGKRKNCLPKLSAKSSDAHTSSRFCVSEIKMLKTLDTDRVVSGSTRGDNNYNAADVERPKESPPLPSVGRSRSRAFEDKYKIAAARANGQESPPLKPAKEYNKKVIHLPLFRINLKTYKGDSEVNRAVENTRENLRLLMEMHKSNLKPANVKTANITNYEFHAPPGTVSARTYDNNLSNGFIVPPSFPVKQVLKSPRKKSAERKPEASLRIDCRFCAMEKEQQFVRFANDQDSTTDYSALNSDFKLMSVARSNDSHTDEEADDSMLSVAIRPDTALTLGSTIHEIDRVLKSPGSDELRELSSVLKNTDTQPPWPSYDEIMKMRSRNQSRRTKNNSRVSVSRPGTVQNAGLESPRKMYSVCSHHSNLNIDSEKPILRYTSRQISEQLKPIIVPSHTCTECPMCNIYKCERDDTPCPPNSPVPRKEPQSFVFETDKPRSSGSEKIKQRRTQEVMHLARVDVTGVMNSLDDKNVLPYMKAN